VARAHVMYHIAIVAMFDQMPKTYLVIGAVLVAIVLVMWLWMRTDGTEAPAPKADNNTADTKSSMKSGKPRRTLNLGQRIDRIHKRQQANLERM
jgi:hypothetical protein